MKKEDLTALGIPEEAAEKILPLHAAELAAAEEKTAAANKELEASKATVKEITDKLKAYDGVDVEKLKTDVSAWEKKYNEDMAAAKVENALELALTKAGAKDVSLAKNLIDRTIIKSDGGNLIGLSEQLDKIKSEKSWLFGEEKIPAEQLPTVNTGGDHNKGTAPSAAPVTLSAALKEHYSN